MPKYQGTRRGTPGATFKQAITDTAAGLTAANIIRGTGSKKAHGATITCIINPVRYALGGTSPTQGAQPTGHALEVNQTVQLDNQAAVAGVKFINMNPGANGFIEVTAEF